MTTPIAKCLQAFEEIIAIRGNNIMLKITDFHTEEEIETHLEEQMITREDLDCCLDRMKLYVKSMPDREFKKFVDGCTVNTGFILPVFKLKEEAIDWERKINYLEFKIK